MPILEYLCEDCQHHFEAIVLGSKVPACPKCQSSKLDRQLSVFAVGGQRDKFAAAAPVGACGACGDPRGPGACSLN
ncbi:MAG: zinc ribbon domain-containing protein [bacterium]|nr:zinc ribbon domain-containing protein [bacterium]